MEIRIIENKISKGEKLSDEEKKEIMSEPMPGGNKESITHDDEAEGIELLEKMKEGDKKNAVPLEEQRKETVKETVKEKVKEEILVKEVLIPEDVYKRLDIELAKPEGQANLSDFTEREKAFYFRMRREQRRAQKAEEERDTFRFEKLKEKAQEKPKEEAELEDPLKDRDAEDFLTVGDVKKMMQASKKQAEKTMMPNPELEHYRALYLKKCEERALDKHEDYETVIELGDEIISSDPGNMRRLQESTQRGDDPAETAYQIIKGDPKFEDLLPVAQARLAAKGKSPKKQEEPKKEAPAAVSPEVKKAEEKLQEEKPKTSVSAGAAEAGERELTIEQVARISPSEWHRLSKEKREQYLRKFGV